MIENFKYYNLTKSHFGDDELKKWDKSFMNLWWCCYCQS